MSLSLRRFLPVLLSPFLTSPQRLPLVFHHNAKSLKHQSQNAPKLASNLDEENDKVDDVPSVLEVVLPECDHLQNELEQEDEDEGELHQVEDVVLFGTVFPGFHQQNNDVEADQRHHHQFIPGTVHQAEEPGQAFALRTKKEDHLDSKQEKRGIEVDEPTWGGGTAL